MIKRLSIISGMVFCFAATAAFAQKTNSQSLLFVFSATSAQLKLSDQPETAQKATSYQLTLGSVQPNVVYFSCNDSRMLGQMTLDQFIGSWSKAGKTGDVSLPVAALVIHDIGKKPATAANDNLMMVTSPAFNASENTFTFTVMGLKQAKLQPGNYKNVTLIVNMGLGQNFSS